MNKNEIDEQLNELGISLDSLQARKLPLYEEAKTLCLAEVDDQGREHLLIEEACIAWRELKTAAQQDGEEIFIVSAFRSISRQCEIIRSKLNNGMIIEDIIKVCAPPGFSEHHSGCAIDLSTVGVEMLSEEFENTTAFQWLKCNAHRYGFRLSYPRDNLAGYLYEPWHWKYQKN